MGVLGGCSRLTFLTFLTRQSATTQTIKSGKTSNTCHWALSYTSQFSVGGVLTRRHTMRNQRVQGACRARDLACCPSS